MAHLTESQKKKRNTFVALLIGILVVLAAIVFVVYSGIMSKSDFLENDDFATALAQMHGKSERSVSKDDLSKVKYFEFVNDPDESNKCYITLGDEKFLEAYKTAVENGTTPDVSLAKMAEMDADREMTLNDIKYFTGAEIVNVVNVKIDNSALASLKTLKEGTFQYCGITDVTDLANLDFENIEKINLAGNDITDWTPLEPYADKIVVSQQYGVEMTEDGSYTLVPQDMTLADMLAEETEGEEDVTEDLPEEEADDAAEVVTEEGAEEGTDDLAQDVPEENVEA